jgi:hypothetical protein
MAWWWDERGISGAGVAGPDQLPFVDEHAVVIDAPPEPVVVVRRMLDAVARSARRGA